MVSTPITATNATSLNLNPATTYEVITREKVDNLAADIAEIRNRVNSIFYLVIGSVLIDVVTRWLQ